MSRHFAFQALTVGAMVLAALSSPKPVDAASRSECGFCAPPPIFQCEVGDYQAECESECGSSNGARECIFDFAGCSPNQVEVICQ